MKRNNNFKCFPYRKIRKDQDRLINDLAKFFKSKDRTMIFQGDCGLGKETAIASQIARVQDQFDHIIYLIPTDTGKINIKKELDLVNKKFPKNKIDYVILNNKKFLCNLLNEKRKELKEKTDAYELCGLMKSKCEYKNADECDYYNLMDSIGDKKVIIADFNYVFSPFVRARTFKKIFKKKKILLIVNEIHELPERIFDLFSNKLSFDIFGLVKRELNGELFLAKDRKAFKQKFRTRGRLIDEINKFENRMDRLVIENVHKLNRSRTNGELGKAEVYSSDFATKQQEKLMKDLIKTGQRIAEWKLNRKIGVNSHTRKLGQFMEGWLFSRNYDAYLYYLEEYKIRGKTKHKIGYYCLNPFPSVMKPFGDSKKIILYSGTCYPERYEKIFGLEAFGKIMNPDPYKSSLLQNRYDLFFMDGKLTKEVRDSPKLKKSADELQQLIERCEKPLGIYATTPLWAKFKPLLQLARFEILEEQMGMDQKEKRKFINAIKKYDIIYMSPFGSFAKSIDISSLKSCIMLGIPDTKLDLITLRKIDYFKERFLKSDGVGAKFMAFYIISRLPAIEKAVQAMSRGIRKERDKLTAYWFDQRWVREQKYIPGRHKQSITKIKDLVAFKIPR